MDKKKTEMEFLKGKASGNMSSSQEYQKKAYARKCLKKYKNKVYHIGDEVLLFNMRKRGRKGGRIQPDFSGPYVIKDIAGKLVTLASLDGSILKTKYSISHIKPYRRSQPSEVG